MDSNWKIEYGKLLFKLFDSVYYILSHEGGYNAIVVGGTAFNTYVDKKYRRFNKDVDIYIEVDEKEQINNYKRNVIKLIKENLKTSPLLFRLEDDNILIYSKLKKLNKEYIYPYLSIKLGTKRINYITLSKFDTFLEKIGYKFDFACTDKIKVINKEDLFISELREIIKPYKTSEILKYLYDTYILEKSYSFLLKIPIYRVYSSNDVGIIKFIQKVLKLVLIKQSKKFEKEFLLGDNYPRREVENFLEKLIYNLMLSYGYENTKINKRLIEYLTCFSSYYFSNLNLCNI
ncbi:MAG: DUF6036 family nucleotidyltransferase [Nanopusillaceae archaeon]|nr:hypothetical protein [Candidatus Aenigmarchaeota archaeon]